MSNTDPLSSRPASATRNQGRPFTITGFVLAAVAVFIVPIILGPLGAIFGGIGYARGDRRLGLWAVVAGIVATILGLVLAAAVFKAART
jgi:hypothetical protein